MHELAVIQIAQIDDLAVRRQVPLVVRFIRCERGHVDGGTIAAVGDLPAEERLEHTHLIERRVREKGLVNLAPLPAIDVVAAHAFREVFQRLGQRLLLRRAAVFIHWRQYVVAPGAVVVGQGGCQVGRVETSTKVLEQTTAQVVGKHRRLQVHQPGRIDRRCSTVLPGHTVPAAQKLERFAFFGGFGRGFQQIGQQLFGLQRELVTLDGGHVFGRELVLGGNHLFDTSSPVGWCPTAGQEVGIVVRHDLVVGGDDVPARRVVFMGQVIERDVAFPVVLVVPSRHRYVAFTLGADGDAAWSVVTDVAVDVGIDKVLRRHDVRAQGAAEIVPVLCVLQTEEGLHRRIVVLERGPAQGQCGGRIAQNVRDERAMPAGTRRPVDRLVLAFDPNCLADNGQWLPRAVDFDLVGVGRVDALDVEVLHVGTEVGHAPGDVLVMADDDRRQAGQRCAHRVQIAALQTGQIPDGRNLGGEVRVVVQ